MPTRRMPALPKLPSLLDRKIYKTGQTRGADDDEIFQNRVSRCSTVLIPLDVWRRYFAPPATPPAFTYGHIVLVSPNEYFEQPHRAEWLAQAGLALGRNCLIFYETRAQWNNYNPEIQGWTVANSRLEPLGGQYVARVPAITSRGGGKINLGFADTENKGAGIRVFEYADDKTIAECRLQLEALFWLCQDSIAVAVANGMTPQDAVTRRDAKVAAAIAHSLLDLERLKKARIVNNAGHTICPLCLAELSSQGFFSRMEQAEGRAVLDLTITQLNLFHIEELRMGVFNHLPYNLGWGHHHCNVVVKDSGIHDTLQWMEEIIQRNVEAGYLPPANNGN